MTTKKKILFTLSAFLSFGLLIHFSMVLVYVGPKNASLESLTGLSKSYMLPLFYQDWNVFAPVPREKSRVFYRYFQDGRWSEEVNLEKELAKEHFLTKRVALKTAHYLGDETRKSTVFRADSIPDYRIVQASYFYSRTAHACLQHIKLKHGIKPDSLQLILERELFPKPGHMATRRVRDYFGTESIK